jgi:hypothetical protein
VLENRAAISFVEFFEVTEVGKDCGRLLLSLGLCDKLFSLGILLITALLLAR